MLPFNKTNGKIIYSELISVTDCAMAQFFIGHTDRFEVSSQL